MSKLLFVCMGNICRSPTAEAVMEALLREEGLEERVNCDSAGTIGYHAGEPADRRMREHASLRGITIDNRARQVRSPADYQEFDLILAMDQDNFRDLQRVQPSGDSKAEVLMMTDFCTEVQASSVPDPYYGGAQGFEEVLDILEDACRGLLAHLKETGRV